MLTPYKSHKQRIYIFSVHDKKYLKKFKPINLKLFLDILLKKCNFIVQTITRSIRRLLRNDRSNDFS